MILLALVVQLILVGCAKVKIAQGSRETMLDCFIIREPNKGFKNCYSTLSFFCTILSLGGGEGVSKLLSISLFIRSNIRRTYQLQQYTRNG